MQLLDKFRLLSPDYVHNVVNIYYTSLLLLASLATTFLWLSTGTSTDKMVAGNSLDRKSVV